MTLTPPKGWKRVKHAADHPPTIALIYRGKGKKHFSPSLNIAIESTALNCQDYTAISQQFHSSLKDNCCLPLGSVMTESGPAELLQIDYTTQCGVVRFLQAILIKEGKAYVVTGTSLQEEFVNFYPLFYRAIQSMRIYSPS